MGHFYLFENDRLGLRPAPVFQTGYSSLARSVRMTPVEIQKKNFSPRIEHILLPNKHNNTCSLNSRFCARTIAMKFIWNFGSLQLSGKGFDLAEPLPEVEGKMARASPSIRRNLSALCDEKLLFFPPLDVLEMQSGKPRKVVRKFNVSIH